MRAPRPPTRVLAYCRVSARDRGEIEAQRQRHTAWCADRRYPAPIFFWEVESGGEERREKRDELNRLLAAARPGDIVTTLLVDRWTRDVVSGVADVRTLLTRGVGWYAIDEGIDASTDEGKDQLGQRAAGAEAERRRIRRRTVGARIRLRDQGLWVEGASPFGYRRGARAAHRHLHLEIEPRDAALVLEAFGRCAAGESVVTIGEWLNVERDTDRAARSTWTLLRHRVYCGEVRSSTGAWIKGQHEAIVTRDLFERAQAALRGRRQGGRRATVTARTAGWLLRGLASCPSCGARMGASYGPGGHVGYYACSKRLRLGACDSPYGRVDRIDADADAAALARMVELRHDLARPTPAPEAQAHAPIDFAERRRRLDGELARAEGGWVKGLLSDEGLRRARERIDEETGHLEIAAAAAERLAQGSDPAARRRALAEVSRLEAAWSQVPVAGRRTCLGVLATRIEVHSHGVSVVWRSAEQLAENRAANWFGGVDDTQPSEPPRPAQKRGRR